MSKSGPLESPGPKSPRGMFRISSDSSVQSLDRRMSFQSAVRAANLLDPTHNYSQVWKIGFYIKIAQLVLTIACIGCYSSGMILVSHSFDARIFPYVVYFTFLIINTVIILSYLMKQKMPELLIRMFGLLGGILFNVAMATSLNYYVVYKNYPLESDTPKKMLLAQSILAMFNAILYYVDTGISYYKSLNGMFT